MFPYNVSITNTNFEPVLNQNTNEHGKIKHFGTQGIGSR